MQMQLQMQMFNNFPKFTAKHLCQILFFNKFWRWCFPVNFEKCLRRTFLKNTSWRLLQMLCRSAEQFFSKFKIIFRETLVMEYEKKFCVFQTPIMVSFNKVKGSETAPLLSIDQIKEYIYLRRVSNRNTKNGGKLFQCLYC